MKIYFKLNRRLKTAAFTLSAFAVFLAVCITASTMLSGSSSLYVSANNKKYIKWVSFNVSCAAMKQALKYDVESQNEKIKLCWIDLLAYAACKNGGKFEDKANPHIDEIAKKLKNGEKMNDIVKNSEYFSYYKQAYTAVLGEFVGKYEEEYYDESAKNKKSKRTKYGIKAYSPIASGFGYSHSDDFGNSRSYGFKREHLGNDLMGCVGTPIISVEDGIVECMGWNRYGGWRIGIRSLDSKRYYYYAHLRSKHPYVESLKEGMEVKAGDVIGYLGQTGYSDNEGYNGMQVPHLHFGIQLIFDESQKDGNSEIWIDAYQIVRFLQNSRSAVLKDESTNEYVRKYARETIIT